ncbi:hypothetical protein SDC9_129849 [bioreactor metagenome]|uniref:Uncharacterized protein n=1 Tax=bioreactor metagenome TaxID=1076179 RepID=A0A645D0S7_9ZZZZ
MAEIPKIIPILNRLEPRTFPIDRALCPFIAAFTLTTNSGALVPMETIVSPIISGLTPNLAAKEDAPDTSHSAPK